MVKKHWCLIVVILLVLVLIFTRFPQRNSLPGIPVCENGEIVIEADRNDDGNVDVWIFANQDSVPDRMVLDTDFDGAPDSWDHSKNGNVFLSQEDKDHDGIIDFIVLTLYDEGEKKMRIIVLLLEGNIFVEEVDSGWCEYDQRS